MQLIIRSVLKSAPVLFTMQMYPLSSLSYMLLTWQVDGPGEGGLTEPDDGIDPASTVQDQDNNYLTEDEYQRYVEY